ncbi:GNAT family N-acetyltransferase [Saccharospirillum alexandrii]|uniref:GNAT family N-acetyltransferase n=1 Tax=Saccharospirillum alexandrii TaxID=2448477 RepID=UPI00373544C0
MSVLRPMQEADFKAFWPVFTKILQRRETYSLDPGLPLEQGLRDWLEYPDESWVVEQEGKIKAIYYLKANATGPGAHVCNCGYMVSLTARGQGLARMMCEHSQQRARELGYKAMQFNSVVSTNRVAVTLWEKLGFRKVGILPRAFKHPEHGYIDSFVMYKWLEE